MTPTLESASARPSALRAWFFLVWLSWQRQARARQMVWIALGLLALSTVIVGLNTAAGRWGIGHWRFFGRTGPTWNEALVRMDTGIGLSNSGTHRSIVNAINAAHSAIIVQSPFMRFTQGFVFLLFFSFLVPIWTLSFATEAIGGERESQGMIWLLTRPLSRPAIYLAKFVAVLPWCLVLNLGGFAILCLAAGKPGPLAFRLFWPAVFWSTITFCALFYLIGAFFKRPAVVGLVYAFFLEVIVGNMPGTLKRFSVGFYARCMMFEAGEDQGIQPENPTIYDPVSGATALTVLILSTVVLLLVGMWIFRRTEYVSNE